MVDNYSFGDHMPSPPSIRLQCQCCGKEFFVFPYRKRTAKFCSKSCGSRKSGRANNHWSGGRSIMKNGYVRVRINGRYVYEHRHIMEQALGRALGRHEAVHHRNGNKLDNRPENLMLLARAEHDRLETKRRWDRGVFIRTGELCNKPRIGRKGRGKLCARLKPCHNHGA